MKDFLEVEKGVYVPLNDNQPIKKVTFYTVRVGQDTQIVDLQVVKILYASSFSFGPSQRETYTYTKGQDKQYEVICDLVGRLEIGDYQAVPKGIYGKEE